MKARLAIAILVAAMLAGCAAGTPSPRSDEIVVTGVRNDRADAGARDAPSPPPPPPPPPASAPLRREAIAAGLAPPPAIFASPAIRPQFPPGRPIDTERYPDADPNPVKQVAAEPVSTFSIDVDTAAYANVRRFLNRGALPPRDAVRIEEMLNYFDYTYPLPRDRARPFEPFATLAPSPWAEGKTLLHVALQGYTVRPAQRPPLNLVLLIDVSGSMQDQNKLPLAKMAFRQLTDTLQATDTVSIVVYAGAAGVVLEPTAGSNRGKILGALEALRAGGSTAGGEGIALAYAVAERNFKKDAVNRVILASDGDFNVGIADPERLEDFVARKRATGIYLTYLGFGEGNYNDLLAQKLTQAGNGIAAYIDTLAEARKVLHDQMQAALLPIADDVKIQVEFNPGQVAEYRLIGYETRRLNREDFSNDRVDAGDIGAGASVTALYELTAPGGRTLIDPLRYQARPQAAARGTEVAFLRVRYKPPGAKDSILIERPILAREAATTLANAPEATRWAAAVAGFGQLLRGDPYLDSDFDYDDVIELAQGARGADPFGWRAEFVGLVRGAKSAQAAPSPGG